MEFLDLRQSVSREMRMRRYWDEQRRRELWDARLIGFLYGVGFICLIFALCTFFGGGQ